MKEEILKAVRELHFHSKSELVRTGIRRILDEVKETSRGANWK
jgi:Arc/MetJ-type ribon-helix-helix transcriptional regulator